jgi:hypothetical protein
MNQLFDTVENDGQLIKDDPHTCLTRLSQHVNSFSTCQKIGKRSLMWYLYKIQGDSRVIMTPTELKMQPTIHLERKAGYLPCPYPALRSECIVGCIFNSAKLIIIREALCIMLMIYKVSQELQPPNY